MTALVYETRSQQTQLASLAQPSPGPVLPDTFNVRWAASPNQVEHHTDYTSTSLTTTGSMQGSYGSNVHTSTQSREYLQQPQHRIYTHDGYFDSSARPVYHYDSAWEREAAQYKHQGPESPLWAMSAAWIPRPSYVGASDSFEQLNNSSTTFGGPVTSNAPYGHVHHHIMPNLTNQVSLNEPIRTPNNISSHITQFAHAAHQPIPPSQQSAYSELSVNLKFMERLEREEQAAARRRQSLPAISTSTPPPAAAAPSPATSLPSATRPHVRQLLPSSARLERTEPANVSTTPTTYRGVRISADASSSPDSWMPTKLTFVDSTAQTPSPPADSPSSSNLSGAPIRNTKEPKKPSLACTFCRERKIACGRPPEGSADPTCNQCARRSFTCKYVNEHPRNPRRSRK